MPQSSDKPKKQNKQAISIYVYFCEVNVRIRHDTSLSGMKYLKKPTQITLLFSHESCFPSTLNQQQSYLSSHFVVVQSLSHVQLFATPMDCSMPGSQSLSSTVSQSLLKFMSTESGILFNHPILCHPLLLLTSVLPSIRIFFICGQRI